MLGSSIRLVAGLQVKSSTIKAAGKGLYTARPFKKGEKVADYGGSVISQEQYAKSPSGYGIHLNKDQILDGKSTQSGIGRYANNCKTENKKKGECQGNNARIIPNVRNKTATIRATKGITKGTEIFVPYGRHY